MGDRDELTVDELRDELRDRDLKVSGTKDELLARLEEHDERPAEGAGAEGQTGGENGRPASMRDVVGKVRAELSGMLGLEVERIAGLTRQEDGWRARADVVEVSRVPPSTDVLATYEVSTDEDGQVVGYQRVERFRRSEGSSG